MDRLAANLVRQSGHLASLDTRSTERHRFGLLSWLLLVALFLPRELLAIPAENVFIVVIDGLRWQDGPAVMRHNMPFLCDSFLPLGTLYTEFHNSGITVTNSANSAIVTGVNQLLINNYGGETQIRPREPTIAEYCRAQLGWAPDDIAFITGKTTIWRYPVSTYPGYGYALGPTLVYGASSDLVTWDSTQAVIARSHPRLAYVHFAQVDDVGHSGDTNAYIASIRQADSLCWQLWRLLQSDGVYRDRTVMFITSDHGRHDDAHGGWRNHGCWCRGCRHVLFFAIGPGVNPGMVVNEPHDLTDIAPTVGRLVGFSTPLAQGTPLPEVVATARPGQTAIMKPGAQPGPNRDVELFEELNLSHSLSPSRAADIVANSAGLHVVFADQISARWRIYYTRSLDQGRTWTPPIPLFANIESAEHREPVIAVVGESTLLVVAAGIRPLTAETTTVWVLSAQRSTDNGRTWLAATDIENMFTITSRPAIAVSGRCVSVLANYYYAIIAKRSRDGGASFWPREYVTNIGLHHPQHPAAVFRDTLCSAVWQDLFADIAPFHEIWFDCEPWHCTDSRVTNSSALCYNYEPAIALNSQGLFNIAYAALHDIGSDNPWQIEVRQGTGLTDTWSLPTVISGSGVGYAPDLKSSASGRLLCTWAACENNQWHIAASIQDPDGQAWAAPFALTSDQVLAIQPRLAVRHDTTYVVWEDFRDGNSEIYFARRALDLSEIGSPPASSRAVPRRLPRITALPNPAAGTVRIVLSGHGAPWSEKTTELLVCNSLGQLVRRLRLGPGSNRTICWNRDDDLGHQVPPGIYFLSLATDQADFSVPLIIFH